MYKSFILILILITVDQTGSAMAQVPSPLQGVDARAQPQRWIRDERDREHAQPRIELRGDAQLAVRTTLQADQSISVQSVEISSPGMDYLTTDMNSALDAAMSDLGFGNQRPAQVRDALEIAELTARTAQQQGFVYISPRLDDAALLRGNLHIILEPAVLTGINIRDSGTRSETRLRSALERYIGSPVNTAQLGNDLIGLAAQGVLASNAVLILEYQAASHSVVATLDVRPQPSVQLLASVSTDRSPAFGAVRSAARIKSFDMLLPGDEYSFEAGRGEGFDDFILSALVPLGQKGFEVYGSGFIMDGSLIELPLRDLDITNSIQSWTVGANLPDFEVQPGFLPAAIEIALGAEINFKRTELLAAGEPLSVLPGSVDGITRYSTVRLKQGFTSEVGRTSIELRSVFSFGLNALQSETAAQPVPDENFFHWYGEFEFETPLGPGTFRARAASQVSDGPLFGPEQYTLGGMYSIRGFRAHAIFADSAEFGSLEYELPVVNAINTGPSWIDAASVLVFSDWGHATLAIEPQQAIRELFSIGIGTEIELGPVLTVSAFWAEQLLDGPDRQKTNFQDDGFGFRVVLER